MTRAWQDCRHAIRILAHNRRLVGVIVFTIAVTVGSTTTVLSVVTPVLLKALPFSDAAQLYRIEPRNIKGQRSWVSVLTFLELQEHVRSARFAGYSVYDFSVFGDEGPEPILAARVTEGFFDVLGVRPTAGRLFDRNEHRAGGPRAVLLTYGFWQRRYGGDHGVIGRHIDFAGPSFVLDSSGEYRVIGVLPPNFWLFSKRLEVIIPLRVAPEHFANRRRGAIETVLAKFAAGVTEDAARSQVGGAVRRLGQQYGADEPVVDATTTGAQRAHFQEFRPRLLLALASAILMFALALVNVGAMVIALAVSRQKEFAVRAALGVSRWGLMQQSLIEGTLLGGAGGIAGLFLGSAGTSVLRTVVPGPLLDRIPGQEAGIAIDAQVMTIIGSAVLLMIVLCAVSTFLATGGMRLESTLREASRATTDAPKYARLRTAILAPQLALAVALVVTTTILSASLVQLQSVDLGLSTERLISFWLNLDARRYKTASQRADFFDRVVERVRALPDVESVSGIDLPANQNWQKTRIARADERMTGEAQLPEAFARAVTPEYFDVLGIRVLAGRGFTAADVEATMPVAIVSRTLADRLWPGREALGQSIRAGGADSKEPWLTVVGVAADVRRVPQEPPTATLYRPVRQHTPAWLYLMIRSRNDAVDLAPAVKQAVSAEDPRQPIEGPYVITKWVREMTALLRFVVLLGLSFSVLGILLAFTGVYGLTSDLSQRAIREIGIRKALGATRGEIIRLYLYRIAGPAIPALVAGAFVGTALVRALASEFEGIRASQVGVTLLVMTLFGALVIMATYLASRRAADVNPAVTMRVE